MSRNKRAFAITVICGIIGVLFAISIQILNSAGILVDEFITASLTLREVQVVIVFFWVVVGIGVSAMES